MFTDYSFRVLMYLGEHPERYPTISEIAEYHAISRHHLVKVVHHLSRREFVRALRGKGGGLTLARPPHLINLRDIVDSSEKMQALVECHDSKTNTCSLTDTCRLKGVLNQAKESFLTVLEQHTLASLLGQGVLRPADLQLTNSLRPQK